MGQTTSTQGLQMPPEWDLHQSTFMSWPTGWGSLNNKVQSDIARVAKTISQFEPVQMLVPPSYVNQAKAMLGSEQIVIVPMPVDDLWARDTLPLFLHDGKKLVGVNYNFNGWGGKQYHKNDGRVASSVLNYLNITGFRSKLIAEGGSIETDGEGTLLMTESSIVNKNRNPGMSRDQIDQVFKDELGVSKIIWVKGVKDHDITDSHIDSLARFIAPGVVMVIELPEPNPDKIRQMPPSDIKLCKKIGIDCKNGGLTSYVNFYIANGGIAMPEFGDKEADQHAQDVVQKAFPDRKVKAVNIDYVAVGGGGIHCATHEVPKA
ncbi:hypothetical protein BGZ97_009606 [Linnemannia gamsii]|uniref:Agmatine deiminase n=1 Tax=Linnemannia gamsii TaxID=64522 RepID=A0A9P6RC11_9FUNG|nr:hypothetical protein BGZ97_009606 [Linnemannia gamsii]